MIEAASLTACEGIRHGFFTRTGGVSGGVYESLNCGIGSNDETAKVVENRARVGQTLGAAPGQLITPYQVHSANVVVAEEPWPQAQAPKVDAIVTVQRGLAVAILTADCTPVLFCDPHAKVVGAAHAGWRGAISGVLEATITAMEGLGAARDRIAAAIGPTISQAAYEVGEEFEEKFLAEAAENERYFHRLQPQERPYFDLPGYAGHRLRRTCIKSVEILPYCTYSDKARFFSYRRATHRGEADYGRQISAIVIP